MMTARLTGALALLALFVVLTVHAVTGFGQDADEDVLRGVYEPELREPSRVIGAVGGGWGVSVAGLVVVGVLLYLQRRRDALVFAFSTAGGAWNPLLKVIIDRERPFLWEDADRLSTYSFPSGHAASSAAFCVALAALLWHTRYRVPVIAGGVIVAPVVGMSRLQLGVHYPSDVVAAWCYVTVWIILVHTVAAVIERRNAPAERVS